MNIVTVKENEVEILRLEGKVDFATAGTLEARLMELLEGGALKLLLNFEKGPFIASSGLRVLLKVGQILQARGGKLSICRINDTVREVFEISVFDKVFNVLASEEDALGGLG